MPNDSHATRPARLGVELLEARDVPTTFGVNSGMSLAVGDIIPGDSKPEFITGTGPGRTDLVRIFDQSGNLKYQIQPFGNVSTGVYVAVGNVNGDDQLELICSTAPGTTGRVRVYEFTGLTLQPLADFTPFGPAYNGGVQIATGNVVNDRTQEIIVGMQSGGSVVKVFEDQPTTGGATFFQIRRFEAFGPAYTGGVSVTSANLDAILNTPPTPNWPDAPYAEVIVGKSAQAPVIRIYDINQATATLRAKYFAFDPNVQANNVGVSVVAGSTDGNHGAEIYAVLRNTTTVRVFNGTTGVPIGDFNVPYPISFTRNLNLTILNADDDFIFSHQGLPPPPVNTVPPFATNLYVVGSEGPYEQVPIVFPGVLFTPAGFNGSRAAP